MNKEDMIKTLDLKVRNFNTKYERISNMKITKQQLKDIIKEEVETTIDEGATLKIPVEKYDVFKRKIEQWGMLFNKFTGYTADLNRPDFDRKTEGRRIIRMANKLESEFRKIMKEFDFDAKVYDDERFAQRQKLDRFDGDNEFFLEEEIETVMKESPQILNEIQI